MKLKKYPRVSIYDTDGGNPYGRELAGLLSAAFHTEIAVPAQTEWVPNDVPCHRILPSNTPSTQYSQAIRLFRGLAWVLAAATKGDTIVIVMTRGWHDQLFLTLFALFGAKLVVIGHDPMPKIPLPLLRRVVQQAFWKFSHELVTHSVELADEARSFSHRQCRSVRHLPFLNYAQWVRSVSRPIAYNAHSCRKKNLTILGQLRADKGIDRIPDILSHLPQETTSKLTMSFVGRGRVSDETLDRIRSMVEIRRLPSSERLSDVEIANELAATDLLLAPYPVASASGTIVLAICCGICVVAYDVGAIADVLNPGSIVPAGDERGFSSKIEAFLEGQAVHYSSEELINWNDHVLGQWRKIIEG